VGGESGPHGIVLLDKGLGLSSNQALQQVKRLFGAKRAGHTGSLDPLATGMLPICLGEATKIAGHLLGARKAYRAELELGVVTTTADREGGVVETRDVPALDAAAIEQVLAGFRGVIRQRPPAHSALKQGGERLYEKARRGEAVEVPEREVEISRLEFVSRFGATLLIEVECSTGTYIRSLAVDLGAAFGCGAHLSALRRLWVEPFADTPMWTLEALDERLRDAEAESVVLPIDAGLVAWPELRLDAPESDRFARGMDVFRPDLAWTGHARVYAADGRLLALGERDTLGRVRPRRVFLDG
jgi:tRNA pseudouridine55 synthase